MCPERKKLRLNSSSKTGAYLLKSRTYVKKFVLDNGTEIKSSEKQVTYWSKNFYDKLSVQCLFVVLIIKRIFFEYIGDFGLK